MRTLHASGPVPDRPVARALAGLRAIGRDRRGMAVVEFALVATVLVALLLPVADIGMGFYYKTQLITATQAGAQYALNNRDSLTSWTGTNTTSIKNAVVNATGLSILASDITVALSCKCVDQSSGTLTAGTPSSPTSTSQCTSSATPCPGMTSPTQPPGAYVTVTVTPVSPRNYKPLFNFQGLGNQLTLTASATVRIQ